jgi:hypothetical protein
MGKKPFRLLALALAACGSTNMTRTGPEQPPREPNCAFELFTVLPRGFAEIGAIDVNQGSYGHKSFTDLDAFKREIQPYVCKAGGDAAIAYANGYGQYIKATILKNVGDTENPAQASAQAPIAPSASVASGDGCHYDTQCKGDRICVQGNCVSPSETGSASASPSSSSATAPPGK